MEKAITWHTFKTSKNGDIQWIWSGGWEWWNVSGVIGRWSWFYLHIYATKYVYFWILQCRLARHWGAGVINAGDLLYLAITSITICSSIVNFFQNFVQYWYTSIVIQLWRYEIAWIFYSVLDCFILEGSCYQLLKSILKVQVHCVSFNWHI